MASRLAALVIVVLGAAASATDPVRPNLTEWQAGKASEAAAADAAAAREKKMAAVDKAVQLLETLQAQVLAEGEAEAKTYEKFACFCKDTTKQKVEAIQKGEDAKTELVAEINLLSGERNTHDTTIQDTEDAIKGHQREQEQADDERSSTKKLYDTNSADLKAALDALEGAIQTLKASKVPSLAQFQAVSETVRTAAVLADALGLGGSAVTRAAALFLQQPANEVQMQDYDFHSDDIITTLEKLLDDFRAETVEVDKAEVESIKIYENFTQTKTHAIKMANKLIDDTKVARSEAIANIEANSQRLATVEASLLEDKEYTNKLSQMCSDKAKTWDQRTRVRADELSTLTQAIGIIKGAVTEKTTAATIRFAQQGASLRLARLVAASPTSMRAIEAEAEAAEDAATDAASSPMSFAQLRSVSSRRFRGSPAGETAANHAVAALLRGRGQQLKSSVLTALAARIAADPFAKVKQLIQELIERLLQEAANEANHKGWCDKAMSDATQRRDYAAEEIAGLNSEMASLEARRDSLNEALAELDTAITELNVTRAKAVQERGEEKAQNNNTMVEAQKGLDALNMCIDLLEKFYKTVKKESVDLALVQQTPEADAPDAGFEIGEAYTGAQSESGGILGMLDVMKSDFVRTFEETRLAEEEAERDHLEFMTETGKSLAQKQEAESQFKAQRDDTVDTLEEASSNLDSETAKLRTALVELLELKPVCVDTGMTYADRVSLREEEIAALKQALCILSQGEC